MDNISIVPSFKDLQVNCEGLHSNNIKSQRNGYMNLPKEITSYARKLVINYSKYDHFSECYMLSLNDIDDFNLHKLSSMIMSEDKSYASEATGPDNPSYPKMLVALTKFLSNPTDKDKEIEFNNTWLNGVSSYFNQTMEEILDNLLQEYNREKGHVGQGYIGLPRDFEEGICIWSDRY